MTQKQLCSTIQERNWTKRIIIMSNFQAHSILHKIILGTGMVELQREHFQNETWFHRMAKMILR